MKDVFKSIERNKKAVKGRTGHYQLTVTDVIEILHHTNAPVTSEIINSITAAYEYGFLKGQRYEHNKKH